MRKSKTLSLDETTIDLLHKKALQNHLSDSAYMRVLLIKQEGGK